jgi:hypothetical protein
MKGVAVWIRRMGSQRLANVDRRMAKWKGKREREQQKRKQKGEMKSGRYL